MLKDLKTPSTFNLRNWIFDIQTGASPMRLTPRQPGTYHPTVRVSSNRYVRAARCTSSVVMRSRRSRRPLKSVLGMLPGVDPKMLKAAKVDDKRLKHFEAIVLSMTPAERQRPDILNGSRRARIARGAGRSVQEVNQLVKQFGQMKKMMQAMGKLN